MRQYSLKRFIGLSVFIHTVFFVSTGSFYIESKKELPFRIRLVEIPKIKEERHAHIKKVYSSEPLQVIEKERKEDKSSDPLVSPMQNPSRLKIEEGQIEKGNAKILQYSRIQPSSERVYDNDIVSLDTKEIKYSPYFDSIKRKINSVWRYPEDAISRGISGSLTLRFSISKDGTLLDVNILRSTNHQILDDEAVRAVKSAVPFDKFPAAIAKDQLNIVATFSYSPYFVSQNEML